VYCRVCVQMKKNVHTDICSSEAAEEGFRKLCIMIEFTNLPRIVHVFSSVTQGSATFKGKQAGRCVCASATLPPTRAPS